MKTILIGVVVILVIVVIALAVNFTREGAVVKSGAISKGISYVKNDTWTTRASKINGYCRVDKNFNTENLASIWINSSNSGGKIFFVMKQGDVEKTIEITGEFNSRIDMNEFKAGRIRLRLEFEHAKDLTVSVSWK